MNIRTGDNVIIRTGKDKGKTGKVLRALPRESKVLVAGVNMVKRSMRARRSNQKGQIVEKPLPVHVSNVALIDPKSGKATRVRIVRSEKGAVRHSVAGNKIG